MMKCSRAGCGGDTEVIDSRDRWRPSDRPWDHHYRRRRCLKCGHRFSTIEEVRLGERQLNFEFDVESGS